MPLYRRCFVTHVIPPSRATALFPERVDALKSGAPPVCRQVDAFVYALARLRRHGGTGAGATCEGEGILGPGERLGDGLGITADTQS